MSSMIRFGFSNILILIYQFSLNHQTDLHHKISVAFSIRENGFFFEMCIFFCVAHKVSMLEKFSAKLMIFHFVVSLFFSSSKCSAFLSFIEVF